MKISALLNENQRSEQGTVRGLPVDKDLIYRARNKYPGYSSEQAMILLIADEMQNQAKTDSNQNTLIDTQKRENERLRSVVNDLGQTVEQEIQQVAQQAEINDREIERIKSLTGQLSKGGTDTETKAKVSGDNLEKLQQDFELLKTKPGMDPEKYKKLQAQMTELIKNRSFDNTDLEKVKPLIATLNKQKNVGDELYQRVEAQLRKTQSELDKKEGRFSKYIEKKKGEVGTMQKTHADEIKNYADIVKGYQQEINKFDNELNKMKSEKDIIYDLRAGIQQQAQEIKTFKDEINQDAFDIKTMKVEISQSLDFINDHLEKLSATNQSEKSQPSIPWLNDAIKNQSGQAKNTNQPNTSNQPNIQENIIYREESAKLGKVNSPTDNNKDSYVQTYIDFTFPNSRYSKKYNEWSIDHLPKLFPYFTSTYKNELSNNPYTEKQILDTLTKYLPSLYNLGDEHTPLTKEQVLKWMSQVKLKLWELPIQQEMFSESLDKTYARMLDDIIGLVYIKKG
jgi:chromosome segregation ATPase